VYSCAKGHPPLVYSSYLGGSGDDFGNGIALDSLPNPNSYITGATLMVDGGYTLTSEP